MPLGKTAKRKFFNVPSLTEKWDVESGLNGLGGGVMMRDAFDPIVKTLDLAGLMESGGREKDKETETVDDDWDGDEKESNMAVES